MVFESEGFINCLGDFENEVIIGKKLVILHEQNSDFFLLESVIILKDQQKSCLC